MIGLCIGLGILVVIAAFDPWFATLLNIFLRWMWIELRILPMRIRLEWSLFWIKRSHKRYERMAEQIRKELDER